MERLLKHLEANKLMYELFDETKFRIADKTYQYVTATDGKLFDGDLVLIADDTECDYYAFSFGEDLYYIGRDNKEKPNFKELRYIGKSASPIPFNTFIGVRDGYEILNGSRLAEDWCAKAKFMGVKSLGICERNTLAGALKFQIECGKAEIKPLLGAIYTIVRRDSELKYEIKVFAKDEIGWENILLMNKEVNVINNKFMYEDRLFELSDNVVLIMDPKSLRFDDISDLISYTKYFQLDSVEYTDDERDKEYLLNLQRYVRSTRLEPVFACDAFYLDPDHAHIKKMLNGISGVRDYESVNQYFKDFEDYLTELERTFSPDDDSFVRIIQQAQTNADLIASKCNCLIDTTHFHLPDYILTEDQKVLFKDKDNLFWCLIEQGMTEKIPAKDRQKYMERVDLEYSVIMQGDKLIDYFLILWDIINYCDRNNILVGVGRGSSGGSLIAYLLNITNLDPFEYGLLFERFLNANRLGKKVDCDQFELTTENGTVLKFLADTKVIVRRQNKKICIKAHEIKEDDFIEV